LLEFGRKLFKCSKLLFNMKVRKEMSKEEIKKYVAHLREIQKDPEIMKAAEECYKISIGAKSTSS